MKVFISMGMRSKGTAQIRSEMQKVFSYIKDRLPDAELIDSVIDDADIDIAHNGDSTRIYYLGESLKMLASADIVFFAPGWEEFRGCSIERRVARDYNKFCVEMEEE